MQADIRKDAAARAAPRSASGSWLLAFGRRRAPALRLLCIPHAGGSAGEYRSWQAGLPDAVEVLGVQLPGRGARLGEPPLERIDAIASAIADRISEAQELPFALFGHSMGGLIAFEVTRELARRGVRGPAHLIVSAAAAPQARVGRERTLHTLPDAELLESLEQLGRIPAALLAETALLESLLPALRADLRAFESYVYQAGPRVACPLSVFGGASDELVPRALLVRWRELAADRFALRILPGDHFYLDGREAELLEILARRLANATDPAEAGGS